MAGYGDLFSQAFMSAADKRKDAETKAALMQWQTNLENQTLTPEEKLMRMYKESPDLVRGFFEAKSPFTPQEIALRRMGLDIQQQGMNLDRYKVMNAPDPMGQKQRDYEFLMKTPGMTHDKALQLLFPPRQDDMTNLLMLLNAGRGGGGTVP